MGMNAVIVILTDELDRIETDKEFGQKLYWAIIWPQINNPNLYIFQIKKI